MNIWAFIISAAAFSGVYLILSDALGLPYRKTVIAHKNLSKRGEKKHPGEAQIWLDSVADKIAKHLKLGEFRRKQLQVELKSSGINETPETFVAKSLVKALIVIIMGVPFIAVMPVLFPVAAVSAVAMFFGEQNKIKKQMAVKKEKIEFELPRFVSHISKTIKHNRDVVNILESYKSTGPELGEELEITVTDMRTGNYEAAVTHFEARLGSSMVSDVSRGLISIIRGDETGVYWQNLEIKLLEYQRQQLKKQALKIPGKVRRLSMLILICFVIMYAAVIVMVLLNNLNVFFS